MSVSAAELSSLSREFRAAAHELLDLLDIQSPAVSRLKVMYILTRLLTNIKYDSHTAMKTCYMCCVLRSVCVCVCVRACVRACVCVCVFFECGCAYA